MHGPCDRRHGPAPPSASPSEARSSSSAILGLVLIYATDQIVPATSDDRRSSDWLAARATGIVAFLLLTVQVALGLVLSHPTNKSTWKLSKRIFPWHEHLWVFVMAFLIVHIVSVVLDPYAGVSLGGAFIPGLAEYRSSPVALGTMALYAFVVTAVTARWTKLLPRGAWLTIHRLALLVFVLAWLHGVLAGTDTSAWTALHRDRAGGHVRRRLPVLGQPQNEADVRHITTGGTRAMTINALRIARPIGTGEARSVSIGALRVRRLVTVIGVIAALVVGYGSIRAAAAWTAASAPLTVATRSRSPNSRIAWRSSRPGPPISRRNFRPWPRSPRT